MNYIMTSVTIPAVDEILMRLSNLEISPQETIQKFFSEGNWTYGGNTTLLASFGKFRDLT